MIKNNNDKKTIIKKSQKTGGVGMKHTVDAMGKQCPIPVVMTKKILDKAEQGDEILILVDNETAVNNLSRLAGSTGCSFVSRKTEGGYEINMTVKSDSAARSQAEPEIVCTPAVPKGDYTVAITSDKMGDGDPELGAILIKGFVYALTQLETPPSVMMFYNGGARLTAQDSPCIEDLKTLQEQGTEILTCGTCVNFYGLKEPAVGTVTNMYTIAEKLTKAGKVIRP